MKNIQISSKEVMEYLRKQSRLSFGRADGEDQDEIEVVKGITDSIFTFIKENIAEQLEENDTATLTIPERIEIVAEKYEENGEEKVRINTTVLSEFKKRLKNDKNL